MQCKGVRLYHHLQWLLPAGPPPLRGVKRLAKTQMSLSLKGDSFKMANRA